MTDEKLNPQEGEEILNPQEGDISKESDEDLYESPIIEEEEEEEVKDDNLDDKSDEDIDFDDDESEEDESTELSEEEKEEIALEIHNRKTGKNYKSWDDVAKSEKQRDAEFARKGPQKKKTEDTKPKPSISSLDEDVVEEVMLNSYPYLRTAPEARKELKELAELRGESELSVLRRSEYFQNRAKAESEEKDENNANKQRISNPSYKVSKTKSVKATPEDIRVANAAFGGDVERYLKIKYKS